MINSNSSLILDSRTYHLSSRSSAGKILNSDPNFKSIVQFDIPDLLNQDDSIAYVEFSIPYVVIPVSFYQVNETNNMLEVIENGVTTKYYFPLGNYNAEYFMQQFRKVLPARFSISLDLVSSTFTVVNTTYNFSFTVMSTIDYVLGFNQTIASVNKSLTMSRCCNFLPIPRICIRCKEIGTGTQVQDLASNDIIISIPNNAKSNGQIVYQNSQQRILLDQDTLNRLTLMITDDDSNPINFNGLSCFFVLQFDIYRKYLEKPESFSNIVKNVNTQNIKKIISSSTL
jgi:hypothetical protein